MKLSLIGVFAATTLSLSSATFAADSTTQETVSGAPDSTVMTQAHDVKVEKKKQKQKQADEKKRGRPVNNAAPASN